MNDQDVATPDTGSFTDEQERAISHIRSALGVVEDDDGRYHLRQALQLLVAERR